MIPIRLRAAHPVHKVDSGRTTEAPPAMVHDPTTTQLVLRRRHIAPIAFLGLEYLQVLPGYGPYVPFVVVGIVYVVAARLDEENA